MQVLAANIDLVLIVTPVDRPPNIPLLERLVVMAWDSGAEPMIVLSKADETTDALRYRQEIGVAVPDIDVVTTSAISGWGIDRLREKLKPGVTAVMLGASGAGKTSLLNSLEGSHHRTRSVSRSGEGRHATTTRRLHRLGSGGVLLDIPGIRLVDFKIDRATLDGVFGDIGDLAIECRFRDCAHASEHGCAVVAAVDEGYLALSRLELWRSLMNELTDNQVAQRPRTRRRLSKSDERMRRSDDEEMAD